MNRLTGWDKGNPYLLKCFEGEAGCPNMDTDICDLCEHAIAVYAKLAAYEDTGASPEQCAELAKENIPGAIDRLVEYESTIPIDKAREWTKAWEDGRLVELPVKLGETVYQVGGSKVYERYVERIEIYASSGGGLLHFGRTINAGFGSIGKTVFFTREEAETAITAQKGEPNA